MNVTCSQCQTVFRVDPAKVPVAGMLSKDYARNRAIGEVGVLRSGISPVAGFISNQK